MLPNGQDNRHGAAVSGLIVGLGRLAKPDTRPAERATCEVYRFRPQDLNTLEKAYADWMRHGL